LTPAWTRCTSTIRPPAGSIRSSRSISGRWASTPACSTVYKYARIGNLRTYLFGDLLHRTLEYLGYEVSYVKNITDVGHMCNDDHDSVADDKVEEAAALRGRAGPPGVSLWMHGEFLTMADAKMAKSAGNIIRVAELPDLGHDPIAFRYMAKTAATLRESAAVIVAVGTHDGNGGWQTTTMVSSLEQILPDIPADAVLVIRSTIPPEFVARLPGMLSELRGDRTRARRAEPGVHA